MTHSENDAAPDASPKPVYYELPEGADLPVKAMIKWLMISFAALFVIVALIVINAQSLARLIPFSSEQRFIKPYETFISNYIAKNGEPRSDADQRIQDYLQDMANAIAVDMDMDGEFELKVHYVDSSMQNAVATLGGHIFVFRGLIEAVEDENSLAMVMGHEIGHIKNRDPVAAMGRGMALSMLYSFVSSDYSGVGAELGAEVGLSIFSRKQELAADQFGLDVLQARYGHVAGYDSFFKVMAEDEEQIETIEWMSTHPDLKRRIDILSETVETEGLSVGDVTKLAVLPEGRGLDLTIKKEP